MKGDLLCCYSSLSSVCGGAGASVLQVAPGAGMWVYASPGERPAPRGPRVPSHGARSWELGSALLWPPRPQRSPGPLGPSAAAPSSRPGQGGGRSLEGPRLAPPLGGAGEKGEGQATPRAT